MDDLFFKTNYSKYVFRNFIEKTRIDDKILRQFGVKDIQGL